MSSDEKPEAQTYARCIKHRPRREVVNKWVAAVDFAGDGLAIVCTSCGGTAILWMTNAAWRLYQMGERYFRPETFGVKLRAGEIVFVQPD